jgi:hypothetical protein
MSWSSRLRVLLMGALLGGLVPPAIAQETTSWELGQEGNVAFADLPVADGGRFTLFCRLQSSGPVAGLGLSVPAFQTLVEAEESYGLTIVVDGARDNFHMVARGVELWFEAEDLNQQTQLARLNDSLKIGQRIELGIATIGWRDSRVITNGQQIDGLLDDCL